jgi:CheY-like chemotaxis protein
MIVPSQNYILVIEDDQFIRELMREILEGEGYNVATAINGQDAIDQLKKVDVLPFLIMLDLMMPIKDGFTFRKEQQADARLRGIPVIVLSADRQMVSRQEELKAADYIKKPPSIDDIVEAVKRKLPQIKATKAE